MKRKYGLILGLLGILVVAVTARALIAYNMPRSVIGGGGGRSSSASYGLSGVIGQPIVDHTDSANYELQSGFYAGLGTGGPSMPTPTKTNTPLHTPTPTKTSTIVPGLTQRFTLPIIKKNGVMMWLVP
jgi:hypothetical protein